MSWFTLILLLQGIDFFSKKCPCRGHTCLIVGAQVTYHSLIAYDASYRIHRSLKSKMHDPTYVGASTPMSRKNRQLVTDDPVEFEK